MTEKLFTGALNKNQKQQKKKTSDFDNCLEKLALDSISELFSRFRRINFVAVMLPRSNFKTKIHIASQVRRNNSLKTRLNFLVPFSSVMVGVYNNYYYINTCVTRYQ